jgi:hypothetical protein
LLEGIGRLFKGTEGGLLSKLQQLWKGRAAAKALSTDVIDAGRMAEKALPSADEIAKITVSALNTQKKLRTIESNLGRFTQNLQNIFGTLQRANPEVAAQYSDDVTRIVNKMEEARKNLVSNPAVAKVIVEEQMAVLSSLEAQVMSKIPAQFQMMGFPPITEAKNALNNAHSLLNEVADKVALTSKNIGDRTKFLNEYLQLYKKSPSFAKDEWLASPANAKYYDELMRSGRLEDIIQSLEGKARKIPFSTRMKGLTYTDILKRVGLGAGATVGAGALGASKMLSWFDSSMDAVESQTQNVENALAGLQNSTSGVGKDIVFAVNRALANLDKTTADASQMMSENMPDAVSIFARNMVSQHAVLAGALNQWDKVKDSSSNPQLAEQAYTQLEALTSYIETQIKNLGANVGVQVRAPTDEFSRSGNISQIQELLNIPVSGDLDQPTINALKSLENKLNSQAGSDEFAGYFYNPAINHVISYQDLFNAKRRLEKY